MALSIITLASISDLLGVSSIFIVGWFSYNQYTKNKLTDLKIEEYKRHLIEKADRDSESFAIIYGELWRMLHELKADRVYILQPHPADSNRFISITLEVKKKGVSSMKLNIQSIPMSEVAIFASKIATIKFIKYNDIGDDMVDANMKAIMSIAGVQSLAIHRLESLEKKWIGNIACEHTHKPCWDCMKCEKTMQDIAKVVQPILPAYGSRLN